MKFIGEKFGGRQQIRKKKMLENLKRIANSDLSSLRELLAAKMVRRTEVKEGKIRENGCKG